MSASGGGVSFSGGPNTYSVSYSAPTFTPPPGTDLAGVSVTSAGPSSVSCGSSASQTYQATYRWDAGIYTYESATVSGTAPACPPPPPPSYPPSWTDNTLFTFTATVPYSDGVSATNMNYSGSYSITSGSLPTGISLNSSTGAITGTPTVASQSYSFTITASNSYGSTATSFSGTVAVAPTAGSMRVWNGTIWAANKPSIFDGSMWVAGSTYVYNGSAWVKSV